MRFITLLHKVCHRFLSNFDFKITMQDMRCWHKQIVAHHTLLKNTVTLNPVMLLHITLNKNQFTPPTG